MSNDFKATYFFDASAIVKMLVTEPGSKKVLALLHDCVIANTSWVLVAEALGCLKRKRREQSITDHQYKSAVYALFAHLKEQNLHPMDLAIDNGRPVLLTHEVELFDHLQRFPQLDVADALQLTIITTTYLSAFGGESKAKLVTADRALGKAAEAEGIPVTYVNVDD
jgi:predicted nucleic acid-binding protein